MIAFDTNVFVYATDVSAGEKHTRSAELLAAALLGRHLFLPVQVLAEYYAVVTRKLAQDREATRLQLEAWAMAAGATAAYDMADLRAAMEVARAHNLPAWDALIWAVCDRHGVATLATEDFQDGRTLGRVTFLNPFNPANDPRLGLGDPA